MIAIGHVAVARTNLSKHKEISTITCCLMLFCQCLKLRDKVLVESQTRDVTTSINTETVHTHLNKLAIALNEVISHVLVLCVEVHAVTCNLSPPAAIIVPVEVAIVVPVVVLVMVLTIGIFHCSQTRRILLTTRYREVVIRQHTAIFLSVRNHTSINIALVCIPITSKEFAEVLLTKVTRVV